MSGRNARSCLVIAALVTLAACGGGGGGGGSTPTTPAGPPISTVEAYRFLNQTTFGATESSAQQLIALGDNTNTYSRWIDQQIALPASTGALTATVTAFPNPIPTGFNIAALHLNRVDTWFANALGGTDQLRQRVAFALSQIMVTSQIGALQNLPFATADYYDMLSRNALGDFRVLLEEWDSWHPGRASFMPPWYAAACLSIDLGWAIYAATQVQAFREGAIAPKQGPY